MKYRIKLLLKIIAFFLVFSISFLYVQDVLRWKGEMNEYMQRRYDVYCDEVASGQEIDVLYLGTSVVYAGVTPVVLWNECGFTGLNFGTSLQTAMSAYYMFEYLLEVQTPKVLVIDFCDLTEDRYADEESWEKSYRRAYDLIEDESLKREMLSEIGETAPGVDIMDYILPIFRYHDRWTEIYSGDFGVRYGYQDYYNGGLLHKKHAAVSKIGEYDESAQPDEISEFSKEYYDRIIETCREKGIEILAVSFPRADMDKWMGSYLTVQEYCDDNGIEHINYNSPELFEETGLDYSTDFYDSSHLNSYGSLKLSKSLANILDERFDLPDNRDNKAYQTWNDGYEQYLIDYEPWFEELLK